MDAFEVFFFSLRKYNDLPNIPNKNRNPRSPPSIEGSCPIDIAQPARHKHAGYHRANATKLAIITAPKANGVESRVRHSAPDFAVDA
jgi:hypothetical protein